jgi:hypothetical protein
MSWFAPILAPGAAGRKGRWGPRDRDIVTAMEAFAELRDGDGRAWRCVLPEVGAVVVAQVGGGPDTWGALQEGVDADERPEVAAGWWMVEAEAGRALVSAVDRRRRRLARAGLALMAACAVMAFFCWTVPLAWVPPPARGGLGFLILVLGGLPALGVYLAGAGTLQFGVGLRERRDGEARAERAESEIARLGRLRSSLVVVPDTLSAAQVAGLAAAVRRALALPGVERALVVTAAPARGEALAAALGRAVASAALAPRPDD